MGNVSERVFPEILILASRYDLTTDFVVSKLRALNQNYIRLNSDDLCDLEICLNPAQRNLNVVLGNTEYLIAPEYLKSVLFRRPVFLREYGDNQQSALDRFARQQWAAFMRNLILFEEAKWINNPVATYQAEQKAFQLSIAAQLGFPIPETRITNFPEDQMFQHEHQEVAIKGLDTVLLREHEYEIFGFTTFSSTESLEPNSWKSAPATIQSALTDKLDLRVTVVEDKVFSASISSHGEPIREDWRRARGSTEFSEFPLPQDVERRILHLMKKLDLHVGCIDLALHEGDYYFFEINPTGEWAWLVDEPGFPIDVAIAEALTQNNERDAYPHDEDH